MCRACGSTGESNPKLPDSRDTALPSVLRVRRVAKGMPSPAVRRAPLRPAGMRVVPLIAPQTLVADRWCSLSPLDVA
jgi:hypothetical protein